MSEPLETELERTLLHAPDNAEAYLVYADWLQSRGDPRGELIAVQHALLDPSAPARLELEQREAALFADHQHHLLGPLAEVAELFELTWERGFIRRAWLDFDLALARGRDPCDVVELLLASPASRLLREISASQRQAPQLARSSYARILDVLAASRVPLEALAIGDRRFTLAGRELEAFSRRFPRLRRLDLAASSMPAGLEHLAHLEELELRVTALTSRELEPLSRAALPLRALSIGANEHPADGLDPILTGVAFARLRELGLFFVRGRDDLLDAIIDSALFPRLEALGLQLFAPAMLAQLRERRAALAHLRLFVEPSLTVHRDHVRFLGIELERPDDAIAALDRTRERNPRDAVQWVERGRALEDLGRAGDAAAAYQTATRVDPDLGIAWFKRGVMHKRRREWIAALPCYEQACRLDAARPFPWHTKGYILKKLDRLPEAREALGIALELFRGLETSRGQQRSAATLLRMSGIHALLGEREPAMSLLREALHLDPLLRPEANRERTEDYEDFADDPELVEILRAHGGRPGDEG